MASIRDGLGVQSYCFRNFKDNTEVARLVGELGLKAIELCAVHVKFDEPTTHAEVIKTYRDAGIEILAIGVETFDTDEAHARRRFEFAKQAGATCISANFKPESWQASAEMVGKLADEYGIRAAVHNHGGYHWLGNWQMLNHFFNATPKGVGLCLDTAWCLDSGENPVKLAEVFRERLYGLHIKDFVFGRDGKGEDVIVGTGNLDLPGLIKTVESGGFDGYAVLEYEGDADNPVPALKQCVAQVK
ncbi:MAG: sugar phosphate isomerase/epimerase family protein [Phycisphaeraceae bacterium]